MQRRTAVELSSSLLILLFGYTASSKLITRDVFETVLSGTPFISKGAAFLAWLVPLSELVIVLLLIFPLSRLWGFYTSLILLSAFTIYLLLMLATASRLPCSCGGIISSLSWNVHIAVNAAFICIAIVGIKNERRNAIQLPSQNMLSH